MKQISMRYTVPVDPVGWLVFYASGYYSLVAGARQPPTSPSQKKVEPVYRQIQLVEVEDKEIDYQAAANTLALHQGCGLKDLTEREQEHLLATARDIVNAALGLPDKPQP